jgi:hypothetical protein
MKYPERSTVPELEGMRLGYPEKQPQPGDPLVSGQGQSQGTAATASWLADIGEG